MIDAGYPPGYGFEKAVRYEAGAFPPQELDYESIMRVAGQAALSIGRFDAQLRTLPNQSILLAPLRNQEAVISSRIEGTVATLEEVVALQEGDDAPRALQRSDVLEVGSYIRALRHAEQLIADGLPICSRLIREAHGQMFFGGQGSDKQPGQFKSHQNFIVDRGRRQVVFVPVSPPDLPVGLNKLETFLNDQNIDALVRTAVGHAEFEALHPFADGNGRIGRMLVTLGLWDTGVIAQPFFYVSAEIERRKDEYIERLRNISAEGAWSEWVVFFMEVLDRQAITNSQIAENVTRLYDEMKETFPRLLGSPQAVQAMDQIFGQPIFTNKTLARLAGITPATAARFTRVLHAAGVLEVFIEGSGRRATRYIFNPLFDAVRL